MNLKGKSMAETSNASGAGTPEQTNNTNGVPEQTSNASGAGAPEVQHQHEYQHEHQHEHHHHHHHHRSPAPIHEMHKVQRSIRHTMKHLQKWQIAAAAVCVMALVIFAAFSVLKYQERKRAEEEAAAWRAANEARIMEEDGRDGSDGQQGGRGASGAGSAESAQNTGEIDYGPLSNNNFSDQLAMRRLQPFANKDVLYNGQHYTRNTAVKAVLLLGLDRTKDDLQQIRPELWEQGQTDFMLLIAHNTFHNTVEILQIPRDTMAAMKAVTYEGQKISDTVEQITLAFSYGDGVYRSCELTCDAVTRLLGGLPMDHYMLTDLRSINTVNDMVGGVTVTIPEDNAVWNDPAFVKGQKITLHGGQAEHFVRGRDKSDDFSSLVRMEHQKIYLQALQPRIKACIKNDPEFLDDLFDAVDADILSDMSKKDYVKLAASMVNTAQLHDSDFRMLPGEARMGEVWLEYIPRYADINEIVLDMFYRKTE